MKVTIETEYMWENLSDMDRFLLIEELIKTAPDSQWFLEKLKKRIEKLELD